MTEIEELLRNAQHEITMLRRANEVLGAKVETMDLFASIFRTQPASDGRGMTVDIVWLLNKKLAELAANPPPADPQPNPVE